MKCRLAALGFMLALVGCKQAQTANSPKQAAVSSNLNLIAPGQVTGDIMLVAIKAQTEQQFDQLGLVECNDSKIENAESAIELLRKVGANLASDGRLIAPASGEFAGQMDCHLLHGQSRIDAKSLTLLNERIRNYSGFREPSRSDISIYELAQTAWVGMQSALLSHGPMISNDLLIGSNIPDGQLNLAREQAVARVARGSELYSPCSTDLPVSPRWIASDPSIRDRQYLCMGKSFKLRVDENRTYSAIRHTLRSAVVSLFQESRGMQPSNDRDRPESRFAITPTQHALPN